MQSDMHLSDQEVFKNIEAIQGLLKQQSLDGIYISSSDPYLNEYVPMSNCHRYYFSGFTGSTADLLILPKGRVKLYVDGRYHEQADNEVDHSIVEVVKVAHGSSNMKTLLEDIVEQGLKAVALEGDRVDLGKLARFQEVCEPIVFTQEEVASLLTKPSLKKLPVVQELSQADAGKTVKEKIEEVCPSKDNGFFVSALDSVSWLSNCRGYHLPNSSAFLGRALVTNSKLYLFVETGIEVGFISKEIEVIVCNYLDLNSRLETLQDELNLKKVHYDHKQLNITDFTLLQNVFGEKNIESKADGIIKFQSIKTEGELKSIRESFKKADQAIYKTIKWVKESVSNKNEISELDIYNKTSESYKGQGAIEQSFNTISGVGPNGSIIHYGDPKKYVLVKKDDMILVDSGGYFSSGFATDTTRTFMASTDEGSAKHKEIYTLVLKGVLNLQNAVFKEGTTGAALDMLARQPLYQAGYDFAHGTGHGVGVHVHEGGVRISPASNIPMKEGQVVSIEPGIYIPGFGGVRIENIATVIKHPTHEGFLSFECLVYIGFEPLLINFELLNSQEKIWLQDYEAICKTRDTSFL